MTVPPVPNVNEARRAGEKPLLATGAGGPYGQLPLHSTDPTGAGASLYGIPTKTTPSTVPDMQYAGQIRPGQYQQHNQRDHASKKFDNTSSAAPTAGDHVVPSTEQIASKLEMGERLLQDHKQERTDRGGELLVDHLTQAVKDAKLFVQEKDLGNSARNIVDHSKIVADKTHLPTAHGKATVPKSETVASDVSDVAGQLRHLTRLIVTSASFRRMLWDFYQLSRDTFGPKMDEKVNEKLAPSPSDRRTADVINMEGYQQPSTTIKDLKNPVVPPFQPSGAYATDNSAPPTVKPVETTETETGLMGHLVQRVKDLKDKASDHINSVRSGSGPTGTTKSAPLEAESTAMMNSSSELGRDSALPTSGTHVAHQLPHGLGVTQSNEYHQEPIGSGLDMQHPSSTVNEAKSKVMDIRDNVEEKVDRTMPRETRRELIRRWQETFDEINEDPRIQEAVRDMKTLLEDLQNKYRPVVEENKAKVKAVAHETRHSHQRASGDVENVQREMKTLLERFAGGKSLDPLIATLQEWVEAARNDHGLRRWLNDLSGYLSMTARHPKTIDNDHHVEELDDFVTRGQDIFNGRHRVLVNRLLDESKDFLYALTHDEATIRLRRSVERVITDLFIDSEGRFVLKPDVFNQLRLAIMPIFNELLGNIQIGRIEECNDDMEFTLDNITFDANDLKPEQFEIKNVADVNVGSRAHHSCEVTGNFLIVSKGSTCQVKNMDFYYKRFAFPKMSDAGRLDATLAGDGLSFDMDIEFSADGKGFANVGNATTGSPPRDHHDHDSRKHTMFRVKKCKVNIDKLKLDIRDAKHETLYKVLKPLIASKASKEMSRAIEDQLYNLVYEMDKAAARARTRASKAIDTTAGDRIVRGTDLPQRDDLETSREQSDHRHPTTITYGTDKAHVAKSTDGTLHETTGREFGRPLTSNSEPKKQQQFIGSQPHSIGSAGAQPFVRYPESRRDEPPHYHLKSDPAAANAKPSVALPSMHGNTTSAEQPQFGNVQGQTEKLYPQEITPDSTTMLGGGASHTANPKGASSDAHTGDVLGRKEKLYPQEITPSSTSMMGGDAGYSQQHLHHSGANPSA